jgi:hypothetical protein
VKNERLEIRLPATLKTKFLSWCGREGTTPSDELRRHITKITRRTIKMINKEAKIASPGFNVEWQEQDTSQRFSEINDITGFANGEKFESAQEVRQYFTRRNMFEMLGWQTPADQIPTQDDLDEMADIVIKHRFWMK